MRMIDADQAKHLAEICFGDIFMQTAFKLLIDKVPTVDAVELPEGKPGDYLEWDNGSGFRQIYCIYAVMFCGDCVRYDLEKFAPVVNHKGIVRIMSREEAKKVLEDMKNG